jgi:hypothetical protein
MKVRHRLRGPVRLLLQRDAVNRLHVGRERRGATLAFAIRAVLVVRNRSEKGSPHAQPTTIRSA